MSQIATARVAPLSANQPRTGQPELSPEAKRIARAFAGIHAYVGLYYDRQLNSTKAVGLYRLYGRKVTLGEVAGVALAELGAMGPERFDFACVLRVAEEDAASGGVSVRLHQREMYSLVHRKQIVIDGPKWESPEAQREAQEKTLTLLHKTKRHHVAVLYDEEQDTYFAEPLYDLLGIEAKGTELAKLAMWALGQYDVATTMLVAALEIGNFEDGFNARFCHSQLINFA